MDLTILKPGSRFEMLRVLAHGAMGVVHEAFDRQRKARVAVKVLYRVSPDGIFRLKKEFRAIQGIEHPNLLAPMELLEEDGRWLIVMELVEGVDLLTYVRPGATPREHESESTRTLGSTTSGEPGSERSPVRSEPGFDEHRLRSGLAQVVAGLSALHRANRVHRDVKPSNILVKPEGNVVILDFGLVAETDASLSQEYMLGTIGYMAPEQGDPGVPTPAADWYSVGVVLYEALTGARPWEGSGAYVLAQKRRGSPTPPSAYTRVPSDLEALCLDLLEPDPTDRPDANAILRRLSQGTAPTARPAAAAAPFIGRQAELGALRRAFDVAAAGRAVAVRITGESGVGKSALVDAFVNGLRIERPDVVILRGRCYENESVPYKALDGVIDSLSYFLRRLPAAEAAGLVPTRAVLLTQAFPVLGRVEVMARTPRAAGQCLDLHERRNRMAAALRDLFLRFCERYVVVVAIDDIQWADLDSVRLYRDVMQPPDEPPLLLVATLRGRPDALPAAAEGKPLPGEPHGVHLVGLPPDEARQLASQLLDDGGRAGEATAIAAEAGGHPLFIGELARFSRMRTAAAETAVRLDDALRARVRELAPAHRTLLEVIAVAGRPIRPEHARIASGIEPEAMAHALAALRAQALVAHSGAIACAAIEERPPGHEVGASGAYIDVYHDRVREAVLAGLDTVRRRGHHRILGTTLAGVADAEALATHWLHAGEADEAARHARTAADQAVATFAFARAARLYQMVLDLAHLSAPEHSDVCTRLGEALAHVGRCAEAARAFLDATSGAPEAVALELRSRAAGQFLRSGRVEEGLSTLRDVLSAARLPLPETPRTALLSFALRRAQLRLRGYRFRERSACQLEPRDLMVADTCWSAALALSVIDTVRGTDFQARHLLLALRTGEPFRVMRGLALEGAYAATAGVRAQARATRLLETARGIAEKLNDPYSLAFCRLGFGVAAYLQGEWRRALPLFEEAEREFEEHCTGISWEVARARNYALFSMAYLGEMAAMNARVPHVLKAAEERGDLCDSTNLRAGHTNVGWLALDDPARSRREIAEAMRPWPAAGVQLQHYYELFSLAQADLYAGEAAPAWRRVERDLRRFLRSPLRRIEVIRASMIFLQARAALAAAVHGEGTPALAAARAAGRAMARERAPYTKALARLLQAQVAAATGDRDTAVAALPQAIRRLEAVDMGLHAAAARRRLGELVGGDEGAALVRQGDAWMREHGVHRPEAMTALFAPVPCR